MADVTHVSALSTTWSSEPELEQWRPSTFAAFDLISSGHLPVVHFIVFVSAYRDDGFLALQQHIDAAIIQTVAQSKQINSSSFVEPGTVKLGR